LAVLINAFTQDRRPHSHREFTTSIGVTLNRRRHIYFLASLATCVSLLTACVGISTTELQRIGSKVTPENINFGELYAYAQRANAAYATKSFIRSKYPLTVRIIAPGQTDVRYFLERNDKTRTQFITVRGSANSKNFSEDLDIAVREDRKVDIPVHAGFDLAARAIYDDVKPYLKTGYKTYLTGHSLGGAVAAILTIYMIEDGMDVVRVVTFGQPRFTTADGVKRLSFLPLARVVDENDIVPMVPPATATDPRFGPYEHVGPEVILLEGRDIVYLPSHDANRISLGEFWRSLSFADLKDHEIKKYLKRLADKTKGTNEVPYNEREKFVFKQF
jgi:triacylglycerol lipase